MSLGKEQREALENAERLADKYKDIKPKPLVLHGDYLFRRPSEINQSGRRVGKSLELNNLSQEHGVKIQKTSSQKTRTNKRPPIIPHIFVSGRFYRFV